MTVTESHTVTRGPTSWAYIYVALGFVVAIEGSVISMVTPLAFPWNIVVYALVAGFSIWLFLANGWFQNKLIGFQIRYENKARKPY